MKKFVDYPETTKILLILIGCALLGFLAFLFGFFTGQPGYPLGWLLGGAVAAFTYWSIAYTSKAVLDPDGAKGARMALTVLFMMLRFVLLIAAVVGAALVTYTFSSPYLNVWTTVGGYLPMPVVCIIAGLMNKKGRKEESHE